MEERKMLVLLYLGGVGLEGKYPCRCPAGRLDTLHVFSEGEIFIEKAIEGPSSYSYI